jgi:WD40 repeat protein
VKEIKLNKNLFFLERPEFVPKIGGRCMKLNLDGLSIAIGDRNGNIRILDIQTFKQIALVEAHDSEVLSVDYGQSSDKTVTFLASSSRDRFVHIFDASKDYQLVATLDDHSAAITAVRFTFSSITANLQLISCSADKSLIFRSISKVKKKNISV